MPPVQQTTLHASKFEEAVKHWEQLNMILIKASYTELQDVIAIYSIPSSVELENATLSSPLN